MEIILIVCLCIRPNFVDIIVLSCWLRAKTRSLLFFVVDSLSVCLYVCMSVRLLLQIASSFLFLHGIKPFFGRQFLMWHFDIWFRLPNAKNLLPQICTYTKSPITRLAWQIERRCLRLLGGFRGWPIPCNHAKCCAADPCCHGNESWANLGYFLTKSHINRLVCQIDRMCVVLPGETTMGLILFCCHGNDICARRGV